MIGDDLDLRHLSEAEWLDTWRETYRALLRTVAALEEAQLTDVQSALLDGEAEMLRRVLVSRGVDLDAS